MKKYFLSLFFISLFLLLTVPSSLFSAATPLIDAVKSGDKHKVELLLKTEGTNVNETDAGGETPLHYATYRGHTETAKTLISKGTKVDIKDSVGRTPLHMAAQKWETDIVTLLIAGGATTVNIKNSFGDTLLILSVKWEKAASVKAPYLPQLSDKVPLNRQRSGNLKINPV